MGPGLRGLSRHGPLSRPHFSFPGFPPDSRLRSSEDVRAALREAQEAAMPEIQEQIQDYRLWVPPAPSASSPVCPL